MAVELKTDRTPELKVDRTIDARGSYCPGPLMELIRAIREGHVGNVIELLSSDSGSKRDVPKWCEKAGHTLLALIEEQEYARLIVRKNR